MKYKRSFFNILAVLISLFLILGSCGAPSQQSEKDAPDTSEYTGELLFEGRRYTYKGEPSDILAKKDCLTVTKGGVYLISGKLTDGRIAVRCDEEVTFVFGGFEGSSSIGALIAREDGGSLRLSALPNTVNILRSEHGSKDGKIDALPTGAISVTGRLVLCGEGKITVSAPEGNGLVCSDLYMRGGGITIGCGEYGIWARNSVLVNGGKLTVTSSRIGIFANRSDYCEGKIELSGDCRVSLVFREAATKTDGTLTVNTPYFSSSKGS